MPDSHYIGSPEDSGEWPVLREARETKGRYLWKRALWFAVMYAMIAGAVLLVAMLAGCTSSGPWKASLEIRYANGQVITSGNAEGGNQAQDGFDSRAQGASKTNSNGDQR